LPDARQESVMKRRSMLAATALGATGAPLLFAGCATFNSMSAEVATFGEWPATRRGGTYGFERLPSQQQPEQADLQQRLEDAARPALDKAGFKEAAAGSSPDLVVQIGARVTRTDRSPWDDPMWWHGGFGVRWGRRGPWRGPAWGGVGFGWQMEPPRYEREVALLLRERGSGKPLYEARASAEGYYASTDAMLKPLFDAALFDFPATGPNPRVVRVPL
jgi:hypothetical protein